MMSGEASTPSTSGLASALQAVQQLAAVRHGHRVVADREGAAGRVVGGDNKVLAAVLQTGVAASRVGSPGNGAGVFQPEGAEVRVAAGVVVQVTCSRRKGCFMGHCGCAVGGELARHQAAAFGQQ